ncbi:MAG: GNAT family N-acetyltransferase [Bifidobacteriaceae bacterium]|jgi:GNAT superfamily N-acetyltransferase|nr:GNAT family N-acetyltransferase [Bifidobacteriaceae bacterium]
MPNSVRDATPLDAPALAAIQRHNWLTLLGPDLPHLEATLDAASLALTWADAIGLAGGAGPYAVLAAEAEDGGVAGFAAIGPLLDPDAGEGGAELVALWVAGEQQRLGHGSRLLAAAADAARRLQRATRLAHWVAHQDVFRQRFLKSAGFGRDGAERSWQAPGGELVDESRWSARLD